MARPPRQDLDRDVPPESFPETVPPKYAQFGHDFTLQAIIEMQKSIGELCAKTDRLISDVKSHGDKIDGIRLTLAWVAGGAAVVGVIVGAAITFAVKYLSPPGH
jgi:hypothetical protein